MLIKISNFSKFAEYITDSVRLVQQLTQDTELVLKILFLF